VGARLPNVMTDRPIKCRSVFVSDLHLGSAGCKAALFLDFLQAIECEHLFLVGDIIDFWVSKKQGKWNQTHTDAVQALLGFSGRGTTLYLTPGNHDAELRRLNGFEFAGIFIDHSFEHQTADGRRWLVVHGDFFDRTVTTLKPVAVASAKVYEAITRLNTMSNAAKGHAPDAPTNFSASLKKGVKRSVAYLNNFEERITADAASQGYDGVICGHIHSPKIATHPSGAEYVNVGDWVEHSSAVIEHFDGRLEMISWPPCAPSGSNGTLGGKGRVVGLF